LLQCDLTADVTQGGNGGNGGRGGTGGHARTIGGAGSGGAGGIGGNSYGGALYIASGSLDIDGGSFTQNMALAGAAGSGGARGGGWLGGSGGPAGKAGQGVGGAAYIAGGAVEISPDTSFASNYASTSADDVFGTYSPS
jgi:hypothetical protein